MGRVNKGSRGTVVILHGLESNQWIMKDFQKAYERAGYNVYNSTYTCGRRSIQEIGEDVRKDLDAILKPKEQVHFVCHSLGGLIARYYIKHRQNTKTFIGKIITMSSPHRGATWIKDVPFGKHIGGALFGPDFIESLVDYDYINTLPGLYAYNTLCITTDREFHPLNPLSWIVGTFIKGKHDGFVAYEGMVLEDSDVKNFHLDHLFMCWDKELVQYTLDYLER